MRAQQLLGAVCLAFLSLGACEQKSKEGDVCTLAGKTGKAGLEAGVGTKALFSQPSSIAVEPSPGDRILIADAGNHVIRSLSRSSGRVSVFVGGEQGFKDGFGDRAHFNTPRSVVIDKENEMAYVADTKNKCIRAIIMKTAEVVTIFNDADADEDELLPEHEQMGGPEGLAISPDGEYLLVADTAKHNIVKIELASKQPTVIAGGGVAGFQDGPGADARFHSPRGLLVTHNGQEALVADTTNHVIRSINMKTYKVSTAWGTGSDGLINGPVAEAEFSEPFDVILSADGAFYYVTEAGNNVIRKIDKKTNSVKTMAGSGSTGSKDGTCKMAEMKIPRAMAIFSRNKVLVADSGNHVVRMMYNDFLQTAPIGGIKAENFGEIYHEDPGAVFATMCSFPMGQSSSAIESTPEMFLMKGPNSSQTEHNPFVDH